MDLKEQLVIWKRSGYLLDHVTLTAPLQERLVEEGVFSNDMMTEIMSKTYTTEQTLMMLSKLGERSSGVFEKFLRALHHSGHGNVVRDLQKTHRFTYFGEMLPPAFTYFLDMSEFLRLYPHIAIKLSEDEKHILQSFIEGKIEVEVRKKNETNRKLTEEKDSLNDVIARLKKELQKRKERIAELERSLELTREKVDHLKARIQELELLNSEARAEVRRFKHFRHEQQELEAFLGAKAEETGMTGAAPLEPTLTFGRVPTFVKDKDKSSSVRLKLLSSQVHLSVNKLYYVQSHLSQLDHLEKRLNSFVGKPISLEDKDYVKAVKKVLADTRKERKTLAQQYREEEKDIYWKEKEMDTLRNDLLGAPHTPACSRGNDAGRDTLITRIEILLDHLRQVQERNMGDREIKHEKEISKLMEHIEQLNQEHQKEKDALKWRTRQKMAELHRREMLHRRMKHLVMVMCRYHAKNMNATVSVEQCRKIVRGIIGESRKLRKMIDDAEELERNPLKQQQQGEEQRQNQEQQEQTQGEGQGKKGEEGDDDDNKKKKKKKRRKRQLDCLSNERLMFVADKLEGERTWRELGVLLRMTQNRMDIVEYEIPMGATPDTLGFAMLRTWRDETKGYINRKAEILVEALRELGRDDLALIVLPEHKIEIVAEGEGEGTDDSGNEEGEEEDGGLNAVGGGHDEMNMKGNKSKKHVGRGQGKTAVQSKTPRPRFNEQTTSSESAGKPYNDISGNADLMANVPRLPVIQGRS